MLIEKVANITSTWKVNFSEKQSKLCKMAKIGLWNSSYKDVSPSHLAFQSIHATLEEQAQQCIASLKFIATQSILQNCWEHYNANLGCIIAQEVNARLF